MFACNGILFNHESPIRGETFVTRKITRAVSRICFGLQNCVYLGNLDAERDWGHAEDYVEAQWLILQQSDPDDFVIATGERHSVREFCEEAFRVAGIDLEWQGSGLQEVGVAARISDSRLLRRNDIRIKEGSPIVAVDSRYFRPTEVETLLGDAEKARKELNWKPRISFRDMVEEMVESDLEFTKKDYMCKMAGFKVFDYNE